MFLRAKAPILIILFAELKDGLSHCQASCIETTKKLIWTVIFWGATRQVFSAFRYNALTQIV